MLYPPPLKKGDTIAVIGISGLVREEEGKIREQIISKVEKMGLKAKIHPSVYRQHGYFSGTDSQRAQAFMDAFLDKDVQGVFCVKGGYGVMRILDKIDYAAIREHPKVFVGYSDITAVHTAIQNECKMVTFHGPMLTSSKEETGYTCEALWQSVSAKKPLGEMKNPKGERLESFAPGIAKGRLTGGNLTLLTHTLGTPYEIDTKGKILFLEEVDEEVYCIDRMLTHLALAGKLKECEGIILGGFTNCEMENSTGLTLKNVFEELLLPLKKPVVSSLAAGHVSKQLTLVLGGEHILDGNKGTLSWEK
ncbi:MAG: LD-carboxypeptidase [Clostridiales bacterium]|nr:LD-carboxypeptidase [Clostridiales bacterium]